MTYLKMRKPYLFLAVTTLSFLALGMFQLAKVVYICPRRIIHDNGGRVVGYAGVHNTDCERYVVLTAICKSEQFKM